MWRCHQARFLLDVQTGSISKVGVPNRFAWSLPIAAGAQMSLDKNRGPSYNVDGNVSSLWRLY